MTISPRARRLPALLLALVLGGCVWPMDPVPTWTLEFAGRVRHVGTDAGVPGAVVEVWLQHPDDRSGLPFVTGLTDASGGFVLEERVRSRATPPHATLRVTPPAGSGLAPRTVGGSIGEVFVGMSRDGEHVSYHAEIGLQPAAAP